MAAAEEKEVVLVGIDESDHSLYALEWALDHFFTPHLPNPPFKLIVLYAKPNPASAVGGVGPGAVVVIPMIDKDLKKVASLVIAKARVICESKSIPDVVYTVVEGDARNVLFDAVERHSASMLVLGTHGYGAFKRTFLGSVSDYCAHQVHCNVLIVKRPEIEHHT